MIRPSVMLIAEDHTGWPAVTETAGRRRPRLRRHLVRRLLPPPHRRRRQRRWRSPAAHGGRLRPRRTRWTWSDFAGALWQTQVQQGRLPRVARRGRQRRRQRRAPAVVAVNGAPLSGATRDVRRGPLPGRRRADDPVRRQRRCSSWARRSSPRSPAATTTSPTARRTCTGSGPARAARDVPLLPGPDPAQPRRAGRSAATTSTWSTPPTQNRVIAFTRTDGTSEVLVVAQPQQPRRSTTATSSRPRQRRLPDGLWQEVFNSDSSLYGGDDNGNFGAAIPALGGRIELRLPANGLVVLQRT